ncbi:TetR/AcrR family transcriptional regulator [Nocardia gipuzkoensis]|uniref:TetR/AcrR family transcriptional regulator n=1 Tax=Nocardia gipuzkoensis TaxID=2749991 RepID=UPI001E3A3754|nr:TetR/AcrR family transcriptional regulator [Nocardia gipuzkoensis]UGT65952.1 TetR/AcrR family transcriptional regulator [Nocardia gipuzkoensis]
MSKRDWLDAGFAVLAADGARALTVERLCADLGLTKGSFYHHFRGMSGYRADLLDHFETEYTGRYIAETEQRDIPAADRLARLTELVLAGQDADNAVEIAMRAWATQDPQVNRIQQRVDRRRVEYLESLLRDIADNDDESRLLARLLYLAQVGAQQVVPPLPARDIADIYALVLRMANRKEN